MRGSYEREEARERGEWERTRWQTCLLLNIQIASKDKITPTDLIEFPWEKAQKKKQAESAKPITKEELERIKALYGS